MLQVPIVVVYPDVRGCEGTAATSSAIVDKERFLPLPFARPADAAFSDYLKVFNPETALCVLYTSTVADTMDIGPAPPDSSSTGSVKKRSSFVPNHFVPLVLPANTNTSVSGKKRGRGS